MLIERYAAVGVTALEQYARRRFLSRLSLTSTPSLKQSFRRSIVAFKPHAQASTEPLEEMHCAAMAPS